MKKMIRKILVTLALVYLVAFSFGLLLALGYLIYVLWSVCPAWWLWSVLGMFGAGMALVISLEYITWED